MEIKIWDTIRLKREAIKEYIENDRYLTDDLLIDWAVVTKVEKESVWAKNDSVYILNKEYVEVIPEESQFEYWEEVEVYSNREEKRVKRFFLCEARWAKNPYICVDSHTEDEFKNWEKFEIAEWDKIRKIPKLTRKEIAEKFWVSLNFELIEE